MIETSQKQTLRSYLCFPNLIEKDLAIELKGCHALSVSPTHKKKPPSQHYIIGISKSNT